ncbi:MAG: radical SAM protein [Patescibacteria group bacterium]
MHKHEIFSERNDPVLLKKITRKIRGLFSGPCERILLINIPQVAEADFDLPTAKLARYPCFPPCGAGLLSRDLRDVGYQTKLLDLNFEILSRVKESDFHYNLWQNSVDQVIKIFVPNLIGISCMFSMTHASMRAVVDYIKRHHPHIPIIAGGVHVSGNAAMVLNEIKGVDLALRYEADIALVTVVDFINGKTTENQLTQIATSVEGEYLEITERSIPDGNKVNYSPEYDDLPIGNYSLTGSIGAYHWLRTDHPPVGTILANRGCRAACTFCSVHSFNGAGVRSRTATTVVDEMERMVQKYGIKHFMWLDDDLFRPDSAVELFPEITRRRLGITWDASNGVIARASTPEMIHAASESGCIGLSFGIESGNPKILRDVKKPSTVEHFKDVSQTLKNYPRMFSKGFLMVGFPDENIGQIRDTVNLAVDMALDWYPIQILSPFGGTIMAKALVKKGVVDEHSVLSSNMFVGVTGKQRVKERLETTSSVFNHEILDADQDQMRVPSKEEMADIWFLMDYRVNYEQIPNQINPIKLAMKRLMLRDVRDRVPKHIPMASLFLGIINQKLGNHEEAKENFMETEQYLKESVFWQVRFKKLGLINLLRKLSND